MSDSNMDKKAREQAQRQWNENPCGSIDGVTDERTYFQAVEKQRYRQQYWQREFFDYESFRGKRVLEIGIGHGTDLRQFARAGAECHGIDITAAHLQLTQRGFEIEQLPIVLHRCDATDICYPADHFDSIHSFGVIHHIPEIERVLAEMYRVMKPGGKLQIAVYHRWSIYTAGLAVKGVLDGSLFRLGWGGVLARIEKGADGERIRPYVRLYSLGEMSQLVQAAGFSIQKSGVRQIHFERWRMLNFLRPLHKWIGWYVCVVATK